MSTFKLLGAVAILTTGITTAALAQQVIYEPGYCAFFYPNANCQNLGPGNPYTSGYYQRGPAPVDRTWAADETVGVAGKRSRAHRSRSSTTRMQ